MRSAWWLLPLALLGWWLEGCGGDPEGAGPREAAGTGGEEPEQRSGSGGQQDAAGTPGANSGGRDNVGGTEPVGGADLGSAGDVSISGGAVDGEGSDCLESEAVTLSHGSGSVSTPSAVWTGAGYAVVWSDDRDGNSEIYFAELDALGQQVGSELRLTEDPAASTEPSLVWNGSDLGLSWTDARDGNTEIYFTVLDRTGRRRASQLTNLRITRDPNRSESPRLIWAGDGYALSWADDRAGDFDVYFATLTWAGTKTSGDLAIARGSSSDLALSFDGFGLVWQSSSDASTQQIYFAQLDPGGARLSQDLPLSGPNQSGRRPRIAFDGGSFGVAWQADFGGGDELWWSRLDPEGELLDATKAIGQARGDAGPLSLLQQPDGGFGMAFIGSADGQLTFLELDDAGQLQGESLAVTAGSSAVGAPALIMTHDGYAAAWVDRAADPSCVRFRLFCDD